MTETCLASSVAKGLVPYCCCAACERAAIQAVEAEAEEAQG